MPGEDGGVTRRAAPGDPGLTHPRPPAIPPRRLRGEGAQIGVVTGIVGDSYTEIKAGLSEGDKVVLPALRTTGTSTTNSNNLLRGGGFGGGGIRSGGG